MLLFLYRQRMSSVAQNKVVRFSYTLTDEDGQNIDKGSLSYLHGHRNILPGVERELAGMKVGEQKKFQLSPEEGYGEYDESLLQLVPRTAFPPDVDIQIGMFFEARTAEGVVTFYVRETQGDMVLLDANHPLAGKNLNFDVTIESIREATEEEIAHGHAH